MDTTEWLTQTGVFSGTDTLGQALGFLCACTCVCMLDMCVHTPTCGFSSIQETELTVGMAPGVGPATGTVWPPAPPVCACVSAHAPALRHGTLAQVDTCVRGGGWEGYQS